MYRRKVTSKKKLGKTNFVGVLRSLTIRAGSGSGSVSQRYGSEDPDPYGTKMSRIRNTAKKIKLMKRSVLM